VRRPPGYANIEEHPKGSGLYRVRPRIDGKLRTVLSGVREAEALEAAAAYARLRDAEVVREGVTLTQFGVGFLDRRERKGLEAIESDRDRWSLYIDRDSIGAMPVSTLRRRDILDWLDRRSKLGHQTQKNALNLLRVALQEAVDRELLESNPARDVKVHRSSSRTETDSLEGILWPEEQAALLAVVPEPDRDEVEFALFSGVRQSSQWWLKAADCHGESVLVRKHKNGRPRTLHLLQPAQEALARALGRGKLWAFPAPRGGRRAKGKLPGAPHCKPKKEPGDWQRWLRAAGITRRVRWHDLRHTCATSLLAGWWGGRKWTLDEVCDYMGHSSVKVTERYARKLQETQRKAVAETKFPGGNGSGGSSGDRSEPVRIAKPLYAGSNPVLTSAADKLHSRSVDADAGNSGGNTASLPAWALALAAECTLTRRVVAVKVIRRRRGKGAA
jgi:integrase